MMDDTISRQAAILLADSLKDDVPDNEQIADCAMAHNEGILEYQTALSLLSPAEAIPIDWLLDKADWCDKNNGIYTSGVIRSVVDLWRDEQKKFCNITEL